MTIRKKAAKKKTVAKAAKRGAKKTPRRAPKKRRPVIEFAGQEFEVNPRAILDGLVSGFFAGIAAKFTGDALSGGGGGGPTTQRWSMMAFDASGQVVRDINCPIEESVDHALRKCEQDPKIERVEVTGRDGCYVLERYRRRDGILCVDTSGPATIEDLFGEPFRSDGSIN